MAEASTSIGRPHFPAFRMRTALTLIAGLGWLLLVPFQVTLFLLMCLAGIGLLGAIVVESFDPPSEDDLAKHTSLNLDERRRW